MKNFLLFLAFAISIAWTNPIKDKTDLLARQWLMVAMEVEGRTISEEMMAQQRRKGMATILRFTENGSFYIYIHSPKGKATKRNRWKFNEDQTKIYVQPEEEGPAMTFTIEKLSSKKMTLSIEDGGQKQIFSYKAVK